MNGIKLGISTQTPLLRFTHATRNGTRPMTISSRDLQPGGPAHLSPGGVCRMVFPSVRNWMAKGWVKESHWLSLQPSGPRQVHFKDLPLHLHHISLPPENLRAYARTKEKIWASIHGLGRPRFDADDFRFYSHYNWFTTDVLLEHLPDLDIAYVHDFQLLQLGALIGLAAPSCFRWHVPFDPRLIPPYTRNFLVRSMEDFDSVIVSTRRDLEGLTQAGFQGFARQVYPHIDVRDWPQPEASLVQRLEHELGLRPDDPMVLLVARMDPIKRQDLAIRALARLRRRFPRLKLVLVGNGSFSGAKRVGLGLGKARAWAKELQALVRKLRLQEHVHFAHWISDDWLMAAYERATAVVLPSDVEGFGLTIFEAWRYGKPTVVSTGAGVSEVVYEGHDGFVFPAGNLTRLTQALGRALGGEAAERVGSNARESLRRYDVKLAAPRIRSILEETMARFGGPP